MEAVAGNDLYVTRPGIGVAGRVMFTLIFFLKGIAMCGAALLITQLGVTRAADGSRARGAI